MICEHEVCVFPSVLSSFLRDVVLSLFFSSLPSFFRFRFEHRLFSSCLFLVGTMLSPRFRFLLRLVSHIYTRIYIVCIMIRTYVRWSILFFCLMYTICFSYCVHYFLFNLFSSWGNFPLQSYWSYWSLSCDHGLHCSVELMWEQDKTTTTTTTNWIQLFEFTIRVQSRSHLSAVDLQAKMIALKWDPALIRSCAVPHWNWTNFSELTAPKRQIWGSIRLELALRARGWFIH